MGTLYGTVNTASHVGTEIVPPHNMVSTWNLFVCNERTLCYCNFIVVCTVTALNIMSSLAKTRKCLQYLLKKVIARDRDVVGKVLR